MDKINVTHGNLHTIYRICILGYKYTTTLAEFQKCREVNVIMCRLLMFMHGCWEPDVIGSLFGEQSNGWAPKLSLTKWVLDHDKLPYEYTEYTNWISGRRKSVAVSLNCTQVAKSLTNKNPTSVAPPPYTCIFVSWYRYSQITYTDHVRGIIILWCIIDRY